MFRYRYVVDGLMYGSLALGFIENLQKQDFKNAIVCTVAGTFYMLYTNSRDKNGGV